MKPDSYSKNSRYLRYTFSAGLIFVIFAVIVIWGIDSLEKTIPVVMIVVAIVYVTMIDAAKYNDNYTLALLKSILDRDSFLKPACAIAWLIAVGLIIYKVQSIYTERQIYLLSGIVIQSNGKALDTGTLSLFDGSKHLETAITKKDGRFELSIDSKVLSSTAVSLIINWDGYSHTKTISISDPNNRNIKIYLPEIHEPIRISYFILRGHAIDFLLDNKIPGTWDELLADNPMIVRNSVFKTLRAIKEEYKYKGMYADSIIFTKVGKDVAQHISEDNEMLGWASKNDFIAGTSNSNYIDEDILDIPLSFQQASKILTNMKLVPNDWHLYLRFNENGVEIGKADGLEVFEGLEFWKSADHADLELLDSISHGPDISLYKHITRRYLPPGFLLMSLSHPIGGCGTETGIRLQLLPRQLQLKAALVENITPEKIEVGSVSIREINSSALRSEKDNDDQLRTADVLSTNSYPLKSLLPKEKLFVPLELSFEYDEEFVSLINNLRKDQVQYNRELATLKDITSGKKILHLPYTIVNTSKPPGFVDFNVDFLKNALQPTDEFPSISQIKQRYIYGPSVSLENIEINNRKYPIRKYDPNTIVIQNGYARGSCPYVFSFDINSNAWILEDRILIKRDSKEKLGTDKLRLKRFSGSIEVRELDPEISHIDEVFVIYRDGAGQEHVARTKNDKLRYADGRFLHIHQGQAIRITFERLQVKTPQEVFISMRGYYTPIVKR